MSAVERDGGDGCDSGSAVGAQACPQATRQREVRGELHAPFRTQAQQAKRAESYSKLV